MLGHSITASSVMRSHRGRSWLAPTMLCLQTSIFLPYAALQAPVPYLPLDSQRMLRFVCLGLFLHVRVATGVSLMPIHHCVCSSALESCGPSAFVVTGERHWSRTPRPTGPKVHPLSTDLILIVVIKVALTKKYCSRYACILYYHYCHISLSLC